MISEFAQTPPPLPPNNVGPPPPPPPHRRFSSSGQTTSVRLQKGRVRLQQGRFRTNNVGPPPASNNVGSVPATAPASRSTPPSPQCEDDRPDRESRAGESRGSVRGSRWKRARDNSSHSTPSSYYQMRSLGAQNPETQSRISSRRSSCSSPAEPRRISSTLVASP